MVQYPFSKNYSSLSMDILLNTLYIANISFSTAFCDTLADSQTKETKFLRSVPLCLWQVNCENYYIWQDLHHRTLEFTPGNSICKHHIHLYCTQVESSIQDEINTSLVVTQCAVFHGCAVIEASQEQKGHFPFSAQTKIIVSSVGIGHCWCTEATIH